MRVLKKNAIKAYKAFSADWTCRGFQYEVGKTYRKVGEILLCEKGFHACKNASDCFKYYLFNQQDTKFAEVLCWGEVEKSDEDSKIVCSSIQIIREIDWKEVLEVCNSGNWNSGVRNPGDRNSGNYNSGDKNSGVRNTGDRNSGNYNSGDKNSGGSNTGYCNAGNCNSGDYNTGDRNSGLRNSGNHNTGSWNSGDYNSGYFNTEKQDRFFCFNKLTKKRTIDFPNFLYFGLIEWVPSEDMTEDEKEKHPEHVITGGYLKEVAYKEAFRKSFLKAKEKDDWSDELAKLKAIPNFNYDIFEEISGISKKELES